MKFSFSDSLDIIAGNAVKRIAALQMGFSKRQEFSLMVDLRSVSFSEFWLNIFFYLENSKSKDKYAFNLDNVIKYRPPQDPELVEAFVPRRSRLFFSKNNATILVPETDVNKIITLNLFTDIVGIEEEKPNGLIQAEAKFHGSLQRKASPGRFRTLKFDFFNYFEVNFTLSKIENKKKFLELLPYQTSTDSFSYIHTFNLLQYQNIEFGTKFNLFKISTDVHEGHLNFGVSTIRTGVRDSLAQLVNNEKVITPRDINLWSVKYRLQGLYRLKAISRVGVDISVDIMAITLLSDKVKQSGGTYDDIDLANNVFTETRFGKRLIATYQAQIYYYASRDESQRLYARLALNKDLGAKGNRFPVMQIGYSADINRFLQFK
jgi:hypothetical protein